MSEGTQEVSVPPDTQTRYPHVMAQVLDTPLLIDKGKLDTILRVLGPRAGFEAREAPSDSTLRPPEAHRIEMASLRGERQREGHYLFGRTAAIPVVGTLIQRRDGWMEASGFTSYARIEMMFDAALNDRLVESIILEIDSPGGVVAGAFDLADMIFRARTQKHVAASVNEFAASAGYLIASAASEISITRTGRAGSIGVVTAHMDYSRALDKAGIAVTYIYAGDKKVDGNSVEPLPSRVKAEWQAEVESLYDLFVETVARNRGLNAKQVRDTKAGMYTGRHAVDAGLANRINTFNNELTNSYAKHSGGTRITAISESPMTAAASTETTTAAPAPTAAPTVLATPTPVLAATVPALAGVSSERTRISGILAHAEATGRTKLAQHLAFQTDMSVEAAGAMLAAAPRAVEDTAGQGALAAAMDKVGTPGISGSMTTESAPVVVSESTDSLYARRAKSAQSPQA